ncbi:hypothetical protein JOC95_001510 [Bacillus tianshenii]|uniref:Lipoprotein n=1 Tax=Sutcliffiella tianshenii TaxID=1463404 RepID=A0ABS2NYU1_9BACI|nr:hypothetical protein [Bacillus tianshenii]MBM7619658.1 hypothetical protein [Bacillus tianshenii]
MKNFLSIIAVGLLILLIGCSIDEQGTDEEGLLVDNVSHTSVDWADVVVWNDVKYQLDDEKTAEITENDLGEELGTITFTVIESKESNNPEYQLKNGEATIARKGSIIYSIKKLDEEKYIFVQDRVYRAH